MENREVFDADTSRDLVVEYPINDGRGDTGQNDFQMLSHRRKALLCATPAKIYSEKSSASSAQYPL